MAGPELKAMMQRLSGAMQNKPMKKPAPRPKAQADFAKSTMATSIPKR